MSALEFRRGFTIVEVIIVIALTVVAALLSAPFLSGSLVRQELDSAVRVAGDALEEARSSTMNGWLGSPYGVHFETGKYVFFRGTSYNPTDGENVEHVLPEWVRVTEVLVTGGGNEIRFSGSAGMPVSTGSVVFTDSGGATRTVSVNAAGVVNLE